MWYTIYYICEDGTELKIEMKFYPYAGSDNGINGGRISKLAITDESDGSLLLNYDRGWDIKPDPKNKNLMEAYNYVLREHNSFNPIIHENDWRYPYCENI